MKLEDQVVSLELAKKLKELGVEQESLFWWTTDNLNLTDDKCTWWIEPTVESYTRRISAYTVAELGEMLPKYREYLPHRVIPGTWDVTIDKPNYKKILEGGAIRANTEADARAKVLIYLIENTLIAI